MGDDATLLIFLVVIGAGIGGLIWRYAPGPRVQKIGAGGLTAIVLAMILPMWVGGEGFSLLFGTLWLWLLLALILSDLRCQRLPDILTGSLVLAALGWVWASEPFSVAHACLSGMIGGGVLWALRFGYQQLRKQEGIGLGDVKLMVGITAAVGWALLPWVTLLAALAALAVAAFSTGPVPMAQRTIPFGAYLGVAAALVWMAGL